MKHLPRVPICQDVHPDTVCGMSPASNHTQSNKPTLKFAEGGIEDFTIPLTVDAVAQRLGCSRSHVFRLIAKREIAAVNIAIPGRLRTRNRITEESVAEYIKKSVC